MAIVMLILSLFACCLLGLYLRGRLLNNGGGGGQLHHKNAPPTTLHVIKSKSNNSNATTMPKNYNGHHYFSSHSNYNGLASYAPITPSSTTQKGGHNWLVLEQDDDSQTTAPVNTVWKKMWVRWKKKWYWPTCSYVSLPFFQFQISRKFQQ